MNEVDGPPTKSLGKVHQLMGISPKSDRSFPSQYQLAHQSSAFSDSSSEYSQKSPLYDPNNRNSWASSRGRSWVEHRPSPLDEGRPSLTSHPAAFISPQQFQDNDYHSNENYGQGTQRTHTRRPAPPEVRPSEQMTSMYDVLNSTPSAFGVGGSPKSNGNDEVLTYKSSSARRLAETSKQHQQLTIRTQPSTKRTRVHFSPSIQRRASSILEGVKESFSRGVDELSSPGASRSSQSFLYSPTSSDYPGSATPRANTPLTPFPDFHITSQPHFFPEPSTIPEHHQFEVKPLTLVSPKVPRYRKFGWSSGKHPLKRYLAFLFPYLCELLKF